MTEIENYRDGVFELLPSVKYLDGFDACAQPNFCTAFFKMQFYENYSFVFFVC